MKRNMMCQLSKLFLDKPLANQLSLQDNQDVLCIAHSERLNLDFFLPPSASAMDPIEAARLYVRAWSSGLERRKPYPGFHPGIYLEQALGFNKVRDPFAHYLSSGRPPGPWQYEVISKPHEPKNNSPRQRVALHLHAYYTDLLHPIINRLNANERHPDLYISVSSEVSKHAISGVMKNYKGTVADIQIVPNRGRDIGPLLTVFGRRMVDNYDVIGHFHTKKSLWSGDDALGQAWFSFLLENLIGGYYPMLDIILSRMEADNTIGLIFAEDPNIYGWSANYKYAAKLARRLTLLERVTEHFNFPTGNMFWAQSKAIKPLIDLGLNWEDYPEEPIPIDGSLLHAIERLTPFIIEKAGFRVAVTHVAHVTR